jgi:hypothetical protein
VVADAVEASERALPAAGQGAFVVFLGSDDPDVGRGGDGPVVGAGLVAGEAVEVGAQAVVGEAAGQLDGDEGGGRLDGQQGEAALAQLDGVAQLLPGSGFEGQAPRRPTPGRRVLGRSHEPSWRRICGSRRKRGWMSYHSWPLR